MLPHFLSPQLRRAVTATLGCIMFVLVTACTVPEPGEVSRDGIFDPYETRNRKVHEGAKRFDRRVLRPVAKSYVKTVPDPAREVVDNFSDNLSVPLSVVNQVLQLELEKAFRNTLRFGLNSTLGFGGLFDVAGDLDLHEDKSDFGHTLAVWGVPEGAYLELPVLGPSTERDAFGVVLNMLLDPLNIIPRPQSYYLKATRIAGKLGDRGRFSSTVDSILYESADSYAQLRLLYLQKRRHELGLPTGTEGADQIDGIDPYAVIDGE